MLNLYIVRHGQTKWNTERRFQGWLDSPLTENGIQCALELKDNLEDLKFDACISSPSARAMKTMALISQDSNPKFTTDERLKEIKLGAWQGLTHDEIEALYPEQLELFYNQPEAFRLHEAETYEDVYDRVHAFIEDLKRTNKNQTEDKNILIVTHGVTLMIFQLIFDHAKISELSQYTVSKNAHIHHYRQEKEGFVHIK